MGATTAAPSAVELKAKAERIAKTAADRGQVAAGDDTVRVVRLEGEIIAHHARVVGIYSDRGEAIVHATDNTPSVLRDLGGSWAVIALEGRPR